MCIFFFIHLHYFSKNKILSAHIVMFIKTTNRHSARGTIYAARTKRLRSCIASIVARITYLGSPTNSALWHIMRTILVAMTELTPRRKRNAFQNARYYHICRKPFESGDQRVRDHCHLTGQKTVTEDWRIRVAI